MLNDIQVCSSQDLMLMLNKTTIRVELIDICSRIEIREFRLNELALYREQSSSYEIAQKA